MMKKKRILVLLGSTKTGSANQKIVDFFAQKAAVFFDVETYPISTLPFFNPDLEMDLLPSSVVDFRQKIEHSDGILIRNYLLCGTKIYYFRLMY
jgi:chromate reductase, NAD(P)H dehydrogenase (quinone)